MRCLPCQDALSARLDGEDPGVAWSEVEEHLADCADCRAYAERIESMHRSVRIAPAEPLADLTPAILSAIGREPDAAAERATADRGTAGRRAGSRPAVVAVERAWFDPLRVGLALLAVLKLAYSLPELVGGSLTGAGIHVAHESGSFDVALAIGLLVVALQPWRAWGLLPVVATLAACLLTTACIDVLAGREQVTAELHHGSDVLGLALLWSIARLSRRTGVVRLA
jgi:predicted anti-sigma-YlaC factor YlaD